MLKKISRKTGITTVELRVIIFVLSIFGTAAALKLAVSNSSLPGYQAQFDYSKEDSLFNLADFNTLPEAAKEKTTDKYVDSKQEVLDFNKPNFNQHKAKETPAEGSINLNKANADDLEAIPGIGTVVAGKIIEKRNSLGRYKKLEELLEVKGIGEIKFNKIKKYLYIEQ